MKKIMKLFVYVAAAAMTLASCQKNEIDSPVKKDVHFTINAGIETKTYISDNGHGTYTPSWENGDQIGIFFNEQLVKDADLGATFSNTNPDGETASFDGTASVTGNGTFYAFYPATAFNKVYDGGEVRLDLKNEQNPTSTSFDPSCDLLIAKPYDYEVADGQTEVVINDLCFARMMSVLKINLNSVYLSNETVKSVSFEAEGIQLTGAMRFNLAESSFKGNQSTTGKTKVTAEYSDNPISVAGEKNAVYFVVAPVTIPAGKTLTFTIETENYDISKVVTTPSEKTFLAGNVNVINLNIVADDCVAKTEDTSDYCGTYAILAKRTTGGYWYMTNDLGTADTKRFTAEEAGEALPEEDVTLGASKLWQVSKSGEYYTVKSVGAEKYITWTSGNSADLGDVGIEFTIEKKEDGTYNLSYAASDETRYLSLNGTTGNNYFALYKSGQKADLSLIPAVLGEEPAILTVDATSQISAEAGNGSFAYELKNPKDDVQLNATTEAAWITSVTVGDGEVTYTVTANESEEAREAVITLTYGDLTEDVTITQAGKPAEGGAEPIDVTISFANTDQRVSQTTSKQEWANGGVILTNNKSNSTSNIVDSSNPVKFYASSELIITAPGNISQIFFDCNNNSYATALKNSISDATVSVSSDKVTITLTGTSNTFTIAKLSAQVRVDAVTVTYVESSGSGGETPEPEPDPTPDPEEPEEPSEPIVATIEQFLAAEDSETVWYQLTGKISNITNTSFGNFDLTDETGTVYVYGLKESKDAGNQTFSNLGLKVGDTVTLIGNRATYVNENNGTEKDEVTNAYYVSHVPAPYLTVSSEAISVASTATSAEFTVDANVEWTVSCSTATATKAGNKVTVDFEANETAEAVVYEVVVNSELGNKTVTITQAAASQGGGDESEQRVVTFDYKGVASNSSYKGETINGVELSGSNIATNKDGQLRVYANTGTFTLDAGSQAITKVELTFSGNYKGTFNLSGYSNGVWTGSQSKVTFTNTGSQARITKIVVTLN